MEAMFNMTPPPFFFMGSSAACFYNLSRGIRRRLFVNIHEPDRCALLRKSLRDGAADAACGAGDNGHFAVEPEAVRMLLVVLQSETPLFQGMKSSWASCSAFVRVSPLVT